ncbi:MAG: hypothetical protein DWQ01_00825 [Planctomycetota bacterium]|nr:MAG: hypothetical protein DWQ01_00825 [Planctomycetota bacterium]
MGRFSFRVTGKLLFWGVSLAVVAFCFLYPENGEEVPLDEFLGKKVRVEFRKGPYVLWLNRRVYDDLILQSIGNERLVFADPQGSFVPHNSERLDGENRYGYSAETMRSRPLILSSESFSVEANDLLALHSPNRSFHFSTEIKK